MLRRKGYRRDRKQRVRLYTRYDDDTPLYPRGSNRSREECLWLSSSVRNHDADDNSRFFQHILSFRAKRSERLRDSSPHMLPSLAPNDGLLQPADSNIFAMIDRKRQLEETWRRGQETEKDKTTYAMRSWIMDHLKYTLS